jgi:hypothetical protein
MDSAAEMDSCCEGRVQALQAGAGDGLRLAVGGAIAISLVSTKEFRLTNLRL